MTTEMNIERLVSLNDIHIKRKHSNIYEIILKEECFDNTGKEKGIIEIIIPKVMIEFSNVTGAFIATGKILTESNADLVPSSL